MPEPPPPEFEKIVLTLEWNKFLGYKMSTQKNEDSVAVILKIEPDSHLGATWPSYVQASKTHFDEVLSDIGEALLAED